MIWDKHEAFSPEFLDQHHDLIMYDTFHQIIPFLLYPLNCGCKSGCVCEELRAKIVLSLNVDLSIKTQERRKHLDQLNAMKLLLRIPDDSFFKLNYVKSYPVWLIQKRFFKENIQKNFKIVERLVLGLLRLDKTYELSVYPESRTSIKEAVELMLGDTPLKAKIKKGEKEAPLCGEKAYSAQLTTYKSVCHFIAALKFLEMDNPLFFLTKPKQIQKFLSVAHWFREKLLTLQTPNIKDKSLFSEKVLLSLPSWVSSDNTYIPIDPFEDKLRKINVQFRRME